MNLIVLPLTRFKQRSVLLHEDLHMQFYGIVYAEIIIIIIKGYIFMFC